MAIQDERSQHKNKAKALKVLRARLYEAQQRAQRASASRERKGLIGSGDRSERIRTYNFPQVGGWVCGVWVWVCCHCRCVAVFAAAWLPGCLGIACCCLAASAAWMQGCRVQ